MRSSLTLLLALSASLLACDPEQDLGSNDPSGSSGTSGLTGSPAAGASGASGASTGGSSAGGTSAGHSNAGGPSAGGSSAGGTSAGGANAGGANAGGSSAGGANAGGTSAGGTDAGAAGTGGAGAGGTSGASGGAGGASAPVSCPPVKHVGTLTAVPFASGSLGYARDFRFGQKHHYLLEGPWVDISPLSGPALGSITLDLNQGQDALALFPGPVTIPASWQTLDKVEARYIDATDETILALRTKSNTYGMGRPQAGLIVAGTDVYWSLRAPARVVEAPLGGTGTERVIAQYDEASGIVPLGLGVDDTYVYWTTGKPSNGFFEGGPAFNKVHRALRHDPTAQPEELASSHNALDTLLVGADALHVGVARHNPGDGSAVARLPKSGGPLSGWGQGATSDRVGRLAELDGLVYYTEQDDDGCSGRLVRYDPTSPSSLFRLPEVLVDGMFFPTNLLAHDGKLYFTTAADDVHAPGGTGALFAYEPPTALTCQRCAPVYASGATGPVCADSEALFYPMLSCGLDACPGTCFSLPKPGAPLPAACRSCMETKCAPAVSACQADT